MIARLGNVLYWTGCIVAAFFLAISAYIGASHLLGGDLSYDDFPIYGIAYAAIAWCVGRACRYVLAGT
jgi:hypothetical protein